MPMIAGVREAEPWNLPNIVGGLFLLVVVAVFIVWLIRRYLNS
jgi:hypothetical protein